MGTTFVMIVIVRSSVRLTFQFSCSRHAPRTRSRPFDLSVGIGFLLPDRNAGLDRINEISVCFKGLGPMSRGGQSDHGTLPDFQCSDPMDCHRFLDCRKFLQSFCNDSFAFLLGQNRVMGVVKSGDVTTFVMIPHQPLKHHERATSRIESVRPQILNIQRSVLNRKHDQSTTGEGRHKGNRLTGLKKSGPIRELIVDRRFDVGKIEGKMVAQANFLPEPGHGCR